MLFSIVRAAGAQKRRVRQTGCVRNYGFKQIKYRGTLSNQDIDIDIRDQLVLMGLSTWVTEPCI